MLCIWCPLQSIPRLGISQSSTTLPAPSNPQPSTQVTVPRQRSLETRLSGALSLSFLLSARMPPKGRNAHFLKAAILNIFAECYLCGGSETKVCGRSRVGWQRRRRRFVDFIFATRSRIDFLFREATFLVRQARPGQIRRPHSAAV